ARKETVTYRGRKFLKRNRALLTASAITAVLVLVLVTGVQRFGSSRSGAIQSIAVLPLENLSHDPQQEPLVDGMTDALIGDLGKMKPLRVIARDSVTRYKSVHKTAVVIARELNVTALVEGSVLRSGNRVQVRLQLKTGAMDQVLWTQT